MVIAKNIKYLRQKKGYSQDILAEMLGYKSFTTIQKWESGISSPPLKIFIQLAEIFDVDLDIFAKTDLSVSECNPENRNFTQMVPVYGKIPAGIPVEAITNIEEFTPLSEDMQASRLEYFALRLNSDSMSPKYSNNDIVIFEKRHRCENGDECAVSIRGEDATFKKVFFTDQSIILQPLNSAYSPIHIESDKELEILGIACEIRRSV